MRVLVTGGNGFVGKHVLNALGRYSSISSILSPNRQELNLLFPKVYNEWSTQYTPAMSLANYIQDNKIDAIIHLAATVGGIGINKDNPGKFMYENLQMGINVLEAARLTHLQKVVNLGTVCAYPKHTPVPFRESDLWNGYPEETNAPYGIAKKAVMELGIAYHKQYGLNVTNLLPVNMAGEYDHFDLYSSHVLPALVRKFEESKDVVMLWGTGSASREFMDAKDCARAIVVALETDTGPEPINLGTGQEITIKALAETVKSIGKYTAAIRWDNTKPDGQPRRSLDVSRAKAILGWQAEIPLADTIKRTIEWYRYAKSKQ